MLSFVSMSVPKALRRPAARNPFSRVESGIVRTSPSRDARLHPSPRRASGAQRLRGSQLRGAERSTPWCLTAACGACRCGRGPVRMARGSR